MEKIDWFVKCKYRFKHQTMSTVVNFDYLVETEQKQCIVDICEMIADHFKLCGLFKFHVYYDFSNFDKVRDSSGRQIKIPFSLMCIVMNTVSKTHKFHMTTSTLDNNQTDKMLVILYTYGA